jgi:hypothetical protein
MMGELVADAVLLALAEAGLGLMRTRALVIKPETSSTGGYLNRRWRHAVYSLPSTVRC